MRINGIFYKKTNKVMVHDRDFTNLFTPLELALFKQKCKKDSLMIEMVFKEDNKGIYLDGFGIKKG